MDDEAQGNVSALRVIRSKDEKIKADDNFGDKT